MSEKIYTYPSVFIRTICLNIEKILHPIEVARVGNQVGYIYRHWSGKKCCRYITITDLDDASIDECVTIIKVELEHRIKNDSFSDIMFD